MFMHFFCSGKKQKVQMDLFFIEAHKKGFLLTKVGGYFYGCQWTVAKRKN